MSYWYRNKEGFPKVSLRERINSSNMHQYQHEINQISKIEKDISLFYTRCKGLDGRTGTLKKFNMNPFSKELLDNIDKKFNLIIKGRQLGITYTLSTIALYNILFLNKSVGIISYNIDGAINILDRIKTMYVNLDEYLVYGVRKITSREIQFNNGTSIKAFGRLDNYSPDYELTIIDEYDFIPTKWKGTFITGICPRIASRIGDKLIIASSINGKSDYSMEDLITNDDYQIYNFNVLTINCIDPIVKQFNRNRKINQILDEKS